MYGCEFEFENVFTDVFECECESESGRVSESECDSESECECEDDASVRALVGVRKGWRCVTVLDGYVYVYIYGGE